MKALKCDFCDSNLVIDDSREFAVCEFCGTKYMASTLRAKIQEIKGTVTVSGAVETTTGDAEKERLLKNATTFYEIGEIEKALISYRNITDEYPDCKEAWEKSLNIIVDHGLCIFISGNRWGESMTTTNSAGSIISEIVRHCRVLSHLTNDVSLVEKCRDKLFDNICNGKIFIQFYTDEFKTFFTIDQIDYIERQSKINAEMVNSLGILKELSENEWFGNYYTCLSYIGIIIKVTHDSSDYFHRAKKCANTQELQDRIRIQQNERIKMGVCQHCGTPFKGVLNKNKICPKCNKYKDY